MLLSVIRLRSGIKAGKEIKDTLMLLNLRYINSCVLVEDNKSILGMLKKVKDYVCYGEIDKDVLTLLLKKRLRKIGDRKVELEDLKKYGINSFEELAEILYTGKKSLKNFKEFKKVFRLHPPKGGFKKSKKLEYPKGILGYVGKEINEVLKRMI
ncbi:MAG: 50S ribosomal protein L30 [Candidatus Aenigmatarchaeota archaeon]